MQYQVVEYTQGNYVVEDNQTGKPVTDILDLEDALTQAQVLNLSPYIHLDEGLVQCIMCECWVDDHVSQDTLCADLYVCVECYSGACEGMLV